MMADYATLLAALVALLAGLTIGKAWERYKLRDGRWIDRRRARESPHYVMALDFLVSNQLESAIEELTRAARLDTDAVEIDLILGNLYREKGQVGRAIQVHQALLQRPKLKRIEHAYALLCLGLDFKRGGFVDRAFEAFTEVLRLDPDNRYALASLEKLHEEQHQWTEAREIRRRLAARPDPAEQRRHDEVLAFLEHALGMQALKRMDYRAAATHFQTAIDGDARTVPAYLGLGDVRLYRRERSPTRSPPGSVWSRRCPIGPTSRSTASTPPIGRPERRNATWHCASGSSRRTRWTGAPAWRWAATCRRTATRARLWPRYSRRWFTTRTPTHCTRRFGAPSPLRRSTPNWWPVTSIWPGTRSSTGIRTSACAVTTGARSCSGSARTAASGTPSSKIGCLRPPSPSRPATEPIQPSS